MEQEVQQLSFDFDSVQPHIISARNDDEVKLQIGEFAGPLDLLLFLIKQEQANIFDIPIAKITDEYLRYIRLMKTFDISVAGDFLVMATTLIEIKSKMLLPRDPLAEEAEEEMEDPREALVRQLLEHQKFKSAAQMLWEKSTVEQSIFPRGKIETDENNSETNATVFDLLKVFQKIMSRHKEEVQMEIAREEMSLADMLRTMRETISKSKRLNLNKFFEQLGSKGELVLAFLAVLELVKASTVKLIQEKVFGEIWAQAS
jgi:segregation and condensation protein A